MTKQRTEQPEQSKEKQKRKYQVRTVKPESMEKGEVVEGRLLDIQAGSMSDILCIYVAGQGIKRIWLTTVLANAINRQDIGRYVKIKYKGDEPTKSGRDVKVFDVWVEDLE